MAEWEIPYDLTISTANGIERVHGIIKVFQVEENENSGS